MKVIFLDIDGVLVPKPNQVPLEEAKRGRVAVPASETVKALNRITRETGAEIVVSSNWRYLYDSVDLNGILRDWGVEGEILGVTPRLDSKPFSANPDVTRGQDIGTWLKVHPRVESFVILDDDADMGKYTTNLVQTREEPGLTEEDADRAIKILHGQQIELDNRTNSNQIIPSKFTRRREGTSMPWTAADATRHTHKANSPIARRQWSDVANSALERGASEGSAVRQANAAVARRKKKSRRERAFTGR